MGSIPWKHSSVTQRNQFELQGSGQSVHVLLIIGSMDRDVWVDSGIWNSSKDCQESVLALAVILICSEGELDERCFRFPDPWFPFLTGTGSEISSEGKSTWSFQEPDHFKRTWPSFESIGVELNEIHQNIKDYVAQLAQYLIGVFRNRAGRSDKFILHLQNSSNFTSSSC